MSAAEMVQVNAARFAKLEEMERKAKLSARKATVKNLLYVEKAKAARITVTKAEVEARIAEEDAKKVAGATSTTVAEKVVDTHADIAGEEDYEPKPDQEPEEDKYPVRG